MAASSSHHHHLHQRLMAENRKRCEDLWHRVNYLCFKEPSHAAIWDNLIQRVTPGSKDPNPNYIEMQKQFHLYLLEFALKNPSLASFLADRLHGVISPQFEEVMLLLAIRDLQSKEYRGSNALTADMIEGKNKDKEKIENMDNLLLFLMSITTEPTPQHSPDPAKNKEITDFYQSLLNYITPLLKGLTNRENYEDIQIQIGKKMLDAAKGNPDIQENILKQQGSHLSPYIPYVLHLSGRANESKAGELENYQQMVGDFLSLATQAPDHDLYKNIVTFFPKDSTKPLTLEEYKDVVGKIRERIFTVADRKDTPVEFKNWVVTHPILSKFLSSEAKAALSPLPPLSSSTPAMSDDDRTLDPRKRTPGNSV